MQGAIEWLGDGMVVAGSRKHATGENKIGYEQSLVVFGIVFWLGKV